MFMKFKKAVPVWDTLIGSSFLDSKMPSAYKQLISDKFRQINMME